MSIKKVLVLLSIILLAVCVSCKKQKKEDYVIQNSFTGSLDFNLPEYVRPGDRISVIPVGLSRTDNKGFGYNWYSSLWKGINATRKESDPITNNGELNFIVRDTTGTFDITCTAIAQGYYSVSRTKKIIVVNKSSLSLGLNEGMKTFKDVRDNMVYKYVKIGNLYWMASNLAYAKYGKPFRNSAAMSDIYGRYYTWNEAKMACPEGWRLPTEDDWKSLAKALGDDDNYNIAGSLMCNAYFNQQRMWEFWPEVKITNKSHFYAIPTGYGYYNNGELIFKGNLNYAAYWTATEKDSYMAYYRYIYKENPQLMLQQASKKYFLASVRCVKDI